MRSARLAGSLLLAGVFLALLTVATRLPAHAQSGSSGGVTIAFSDDRALILDREVISKTHAFSVSLINLDTRNTQTISVTLTGSPAAGRTLGQLLAEQPAPQQVKPLAAAMFNFTLAITDQTPSGAYPGVLVALGSQGDLLRRPVSLTIAARPAPAVPLPTPGPTGTYPIVTTGTDAFTMTGANRLPSPINPLRPFALWLGVLLLVTGTWLIYRATSTQPGEAGGLVGSGAGTDSPARDASMNSLADGGRAFIVALGLVSLLYGLGLWGSPLAPSAVVVTPVSLFPTPASAGAQAGLVSDKNGDTGVLVYQNDALTAQGLPRAGTYTGKLGDQGPKVTVNVADAWPWAAATLLAGVLLAFWLGRYYTDTRPQRAARALAAQVGREIAATESDWQRKHAGSRLGGYSVAGLAQKWIAWSLKIAERGDTTAATTHLNNLAAYVDLYRTVLSHLEQLAHLTAAGDNKLLHGQDLPIDITLLDKPDLAEREKALLDELQGQDQKVVKATTTAQAGFALALPAPSKKEGAPRRLPVPITWVDAGPVTEGRADLDDLYHLSVERTDLPDAGDGKPAKYHWDFGDGTASESFAPDSQAKTVESGHCFAAGGDRTVSLVLDSTAGLYVAGTVVARTRPPIPVRAGPGRAALSRENLRLDDVQMTFVSGLIAIGTGLAVLYFASSAWGSPADYLTAVLWGSIGTQGIKSVAGLVQGKWLNA